MDRNFVEESLLSATEQNGLVTEDGKTAVFNTIKSGIESGLQKPRVDLLKNASEISKNKVYKYRDEKGGFLFEVVKIPPKTDTGKKIFYQRRYDEDRNPIHGILEGWYEKNKKNCWKRIKECSDKNIQPNINDKWFDEARRVPYKLLELIQSVKDQKLIYYCEGEKDVDRLRREGLSATTNPMGADKEMSDSFYQYFQDSDIAIIEDHNEAGRKQSKLLLKKLKPVAKSVTTIQLPSLKEGEDVSDWLDKGNSLQYFKEFIEKEKISQSKQKRKLVAINVKDFLLMELPARELLLKPILPRQGLIMIHSLRGVGKTFMALGIAYAGAVGGRFLKWKAMKPIRVLYIDGEMPAIVMQERLSRIIKANSIESFNHENLKIITPDLQNKPIPDLASKEGKENLMEYCDDFDLLILDNLSTLSRSGKENEAESWVPIQELALELRKKGKSVLFIHHSGKTGLQRGTSRKEDILDTVITLKHPKGYSPEEGARFEVHFEKNRGFYGDDAKSFEALLALDGSWTMKDLEDNIDDQIIELTKDGKGCKEIGEIVGKDKSTISRRQKNLRKQGKL